MPKKIKYEDLDFSRWPRNLDRISEEKYDEWTEYRKRPVTGRVLKSIGIHLLQLDYYHCVGPHIALAVMLDKGWESLKYDWVVNEMRSEIQSVKIGDYHWSDEPGSEKVNIQSILMVKS